jgi:hypothetical protein
MRDGSHGCVLFKFRFLLLLHFKVYAICLFHLHNFTNLIFVIPSFHGSTKMSFSLWLVFPNFIWQSVCGLPFIDVVFPSVQ